MNSVAYNEFSWIRLNSRNTENPVRIQALQKEYKKNLWLQMNTQEISWIQTEFVRIQWIFLNTSEFAEYRKYRQNTRIAEGIQKSSLITDEYTGIHLNSNWIRENTMYFFEYVWIRGIKKIPSEYKNCRRNAKKFSDYKWIHGNSPEFKLNSVEYNEFARGAEVMNTYEYTWIQHDCVWIL